MNTSFDITDIDCTPKELEDALGLSGRTALRFLSKRNLPTVPCLADSTKLLCGWPP